MGHNCRDHASRLTSPIVRQVSSMDDPDRRTGGEADLKLTGRGLLGEGEAERLCILFEGSEATSPELVLVGLLADVHVVLAVAQHAVHESGDLTSSREDGHRRTFVAGDTAE